MARLASFWSVRMQANACQAAPASLPDTVELSGIQARNTAGAPCGCTGLFRRLHFRRGGVSLWRPLQAVQSVCQRPKCSLLGGAAVKRWRGQANGAGGNGHQGWRKGSISSKWPPTMAKNIVAVVVQHGVPCTNAWSQHNKSNQINKARSSSCRHPDGVYHRRWFVARWLESSKCP